MSLELWERSSEDTKERWRDIARTLRDTGDAEAIPRALQTCFWFGAQAVRSGGGPRTEMSLLNLLPNDLAAQLMKSAAGGAPDGTGAGPATGPRS